MDTGDLSDAFLIAVGAYDRSELVSDFKKKLKANMQDVRSWRLDALMLYDPDYKELKDVQKKLGVAISKHIRNPTIGTLVDINTAVYAYSHKLAGTGLDFDHTWCVWFLSARVNWVEKLQGYEQMCQALQKFASGEWVSVDAGNFFGSKDLHRACALHMSTEKPGMIAYYPSIDHMIKGREVRTTFGRYLKKMFPDMTDKEIQDASERHAFFTSQAELLYARSESEVIDVYQNGPGSCMSGDSFFKGHIHPAAVYGHDDGDPTWDTDTEVLYIRGLSEGISARVVCNKLTKECARIYGDESRMKPALEAAGYTQAVNALVGARIRRIPDKDTEADIMPYVDAGISSGGGSLYVTMSPDCRHYVLGECGSFSTHCGNENDGLTTVDETQECSHCGDSFDPDDLTYFEDHGEVCQHCLDRLFVYAHTGEGRERYILIDDAIYCESNVEYYSSRYAERCGIRMCEFLDQHFFGDELCLTSYGRVHQSQCVELDRPDPYGNDYALKSDASEFEGEMLHEETIEEIEAEREEAEREEAEREEERLKVIEKLETTTTA